MSTPFEVTVIALSRLPEIDLEAILGQGAAFRIQTAVEDEMPAMMRSCPGICSHRGARRVAEVGGDRASPPICLFFVPHRVGLAESS